MLLLAGCGNVLDPHSAALSDPAKAPIAAFSGQTRLYVSTNVVVDGYQLTHDGYVQLGVAAFTTERAVTVGQSETGGIITAAGLIMIAVFGGFVLGDGRVIKLLGIGLASAIFLDAFIVRTMLVPSIMHRLGASNWWYPAWLDKITPQISIEPPDEVEEPGEGHGERTLIDA